MSIIALAPAINREPLSQEIVRKIAVVGASKLPGWDTKPGTQLDWFGWQQLDGKLDLLDYDTLVLNLLPVSVGQERSRQQVDWEAFSQAINFPAVMAMLDRGGEIIVVGNPRFEIPRPAAKGARPPDNTPLLNAIYINFVTGEPYYPIASLIASQLGIPWLAGFGRFLKKPKPPLPEYRPFLDFTGLNFEWNAQLVTQPTLKKAAPDRLLKRFGSYLAQFKHCNYTLVGTTFNPAYFQFSPQTNQSELSQQITQPFYQTDEGNKGVIFSLYPHRTLAHLNTSGRLTELRRRGGIVFLPGLPLSQEKEALNITLRGICGCSSD